MFATMMVKTFVMRYWRRQFVIFKSKTDEILAQGHDSRYRLSSVRNTETATRQKVEKTYF